MPTGARGRRARSSCSRRSSRVYGRCSNEHIISGPGLVNIYQFTHDAFGSRTFISPAAFVPARTCAGVGTIDDPADLPAAISASAMREALRDSASSRSTCSSTAYGAEAGNLALRTVGHGGRLRRRRHRAEDPPAASTSGLFLDAFRAKEPLAAFVATIPVAVILNSEAGLLGAAVHANSAA